MKAIRTVKNILALTTMFVLGISISFLWLRGSGIFESLHNLAGGNLLSPVAILFSATLASLATYTGLKENNQRHIKEQTLKVLNYKRYTWPALRAIQTVLDEIDNKKQASTDEVFDKYINEKRLMCPEMAQILSYLDSYQHIAWGVKRGLYDEELTRLLIGRQMCFLYKKAKTYIQWRIENESDGPAKQAGNFKELVSFADTWCKTTDNVEKLSINHD